MAGGSLAERHDARHKHGADSGRSYSGDDTTYSRRLRRRSSRALFLLVDVGERHHPASAMSRESTSSAGPLRCASSAKREDHLDREEPRVVDPRAKPLRTRTPSRSADSED